MNDYQKERFFFIKNMKKKLFLFIRNNGIYFGRHLKF